MKIKTNNPKKARIDIIPLIDVVFLLLIFFIYAMLTMSVNKGVELNLPQSANAKTVKKNNISISVKADNTLYINKEKISPSQINIILTEKIKTNQNPTVLLFADKEVKYQTVFEIIDKIQKAGIYKISLQAEKAEEKEE